MSRGYVIGGRMGATFVRGVNVETLGQAVLLPALQLNLTELGPFVTHYFDPSAGTFVRGSVNLSRLAPRRAQAEEFSEGEPLGNDLRGVSVVISGGHEVWVARQISLGLVGSLRYLHALQPSGTFALGPAVEMSFHWH